VHRGEDEPEVGKSGVAQELAEAGAAYAGAAQQRRRADEKSGDSGEGPADEAQERPEDDETETYR
jgi:hypothetical protein